MSSKLPSNINPSNINPNSTNFNSFNFDPGTIVASKYEVLSQIAPGWGGEIYRVKEQTTNITRTAKFFFPSFNKGKRVSTVHAKKLHRLRNCPILIPYHVYEELSYGGHQIVCLLSENVEGELLCDFLQRQRGKRLTNFQAIHLLYNLVIGLEAIHAKGDFHGELHCQNIIVKRKGLSFELKLLDLSQPQAPCSKRALLQKDIFALIRIFYKSLGGSRTYAKHPKAVKEICCGLKHGLTLQKFPNLKKLRMHIEHMQWN